MTKFIIFYLLFKFSSGIIKYKTNKQYLEKIKFPSYTLYKKTQIYKKIL